MFVGISHNVATVEIPSMWSDDRPYMAVVFLSNRIQPLLHLRSQHLLYRNNIYLFETRFQIIYLRVLILPTRTIGLIPRSTMACSASSIHLWHDYIGIYSEKVFFLLAGKSNWQSLSGKAPLMSIGEARNHAPKWGKREKAPRQLHVFCVFQEQQHCSPSVLFKSKFSYLTKCSFI